MFDSQPSRDYGEVVETPWYSFFQREKGFGAGVTEGFRERAGKKYG